MGHRFWGVALVVVGALVLLQVSGQIYLGLSFWPVVLTLIGANILWGSIRGRSWLGMGLGLWVGGMGVVDILANLGYATWSGGEPVWKFWPLLLVAIGLSMLFGRPKCRFHRNIHVKL